MRCIDIDIEDGKGQISLAINAEDHARFAAFMVDAKKLREQYDTLSESLRSALAVVDKVEKS